MDPLIRDTFDFATEAVVETLGETVTYTGGMVVGLEVEAVFGSEGITVQSGDVRASSKRPEILLRKDALVDAAGTPHEPQKDDLVQIRGDTYEVARALQDTEEVSWRLALKLVT